MPSYEKINYMLRPNKSVERKMVCEMLSKISIISDLAAYQYVGFGSTYFADFSLFHRTLGITQMISIEGEDKAKQRCEFNKPFSCIELKMGSSSDILPNLNFKEKDSIVWLDYDSIISDTVFSDINTVFSAIRPNSFFMLSLNADFFKIKNNVEGDGDNEAIQQYLLGLIGEERFPNKYLDVKFTSKVYLSFLYDCIIDEINSSIMKRNGVEDYDLMFHQSIYFVYQDGARMITVGGFIFDSKNVAEQLNKISITQLPFYKNKEFPFEIKCPILSIKEIQALNSYLPCEFKDGKIDDENLNNFPVENECILQYSSLYRYYPNYTEALI